MFKYLRVIGIFLYSIFRKIYMYLPFVLVWFYPISLLIWVHLSLAIYFRGYGRNVVHNYALANKSKLYIPRLFERPISELGNQIVMLYPITNTLHKVPYNFYGYLIKPYHGTDGGFIEYKKISWLEFQLVFWLIWGWADDDSNHDTMSGGERPNMKYGNSFDLGDNRARYPEFNFSESIKWMIRNTAYNFKYTHSEIRQHNKNNFYVRFTNRFFDWHFGYIPYTNSRRKGRLVYFSEDIKYIDK